ncbi:MAG TPA: DUF5655 domain-containing protein [Thermoanaerobaculia bacterium]|nr:DUF5655 domain-containing protein [Thermoanaerobaculia bacterium]
MGDIKLFRTTNGTAQELGGTAASLEKSLQTLMERNLETLLGVRFLASEYSAGKRHGGRLDTLGIDENGSPVIIEYKRSLNENVVNQGLFYLDWLMDHQAEFKLLVMEKLGRADADAIEWGGPRLLCIAGDFTRYDEYAVAQMNRNIELIRYRRFGDELLLPELVNATTASPAEGGRPPEPKKSKTPGYRTIDQTLEELSGPLLDLYEELKSFLLALGDDVQMKVLRFYVAFKRIKNFACVEVHPRAGDVKVYVKVDPGTIQLEEGFTRDVRNIGHFGTGDLEISVRSRQDLERAKGLVLQSYEAS